MMKISHSLLLIAGCFSVVGLSSSSSSSSISNPSARQTILFILSPTSTSTSTTPTSTTLSSQQRQRGRRCCRLDMMTTMMTTTRATTVTTTQRHSRTSKLVGMLHMSPPPSLGNNYLDSIDGRKNDDDKDDDNDNYDGNASSSSSSGRFRNNDGRRRDENNHNNNNRWGSLFGQPSSSSSANLAGGGGAGSGRGGMGGMRTAIRPIPPSNSPGGGMFANNNNANDQSTLEKNNYGIGGGKLQMNLSPRIVPINRPQDLLDFVIQDERLSVVKVYASWCKTCQVFDVRYRKLASQLGDNINTNTNDPTSSSSTTTRGSVRFAEMRFDDPNNEEMCRLLNATKLPYILMYRGSRGKVADFQCGPANFQLLIDAVNEHVDADVMGAGGVEQEWRVVREQQQVRNQQMRRAQQAAQYGGSGSIANYQPSFDGDILKRKEDEITRLYTELSNLRKGFDQSIVRLKEEHKQETTVLNERIQRLTKEYDEERRALSAQIKDLSREMMDREKAIRSSENAINQGLRNEMKRKEDEFAATLSGLSSRIAELERDLLQSNNALQYNSNSETKERQQLLNHIATLEQRISELEKELIEEKRVVVASTEEASRVLRQLEKIRNSEDKERILLSARIEELEADIARREEQMMNYSANGGGAGNTALENMQRQMDELRKARDEEIDLLRTRIADLEEELDWQSRTSSMDENTSAQQLQMQQQELLKESKKLTSRIVELENEIDERDKLLRTSNKATDILLDNMEAQKRDYERELDRTASLVNELEEAIALREEEMRMFQERYEVLERMVEELKRREDQRELAAGNAFANAVQIAEIRSKQQQQQQQQISQGAPFTFDSLFGGSTGQTRSSGWDGSSDEDSVENYELLKDVLLPDEVAPRGGQSMPPSGAGRSDNIWENVGAGLSSLMSSSFSGAGRYDDTRAGAGTASFGGNTPSPAAVNVPPGIPTPAMAFERRLAENPIVPAGAFGGSKPTSSFFSRSSKSSESTPAPSDTPDYYQNVISNFNNNDPAISPRATYEQRPTAPSPRVPATAGMTENIYAGAGSASTYPSPAAIRQDEIIAPVPTPAAAFERRLAENPIVPSGAFGGAKPTAHFFSPKSAPASSTTGVGGPSIPPEDDPQSKWRKLDESEKKRVAAEAYKAFEKSLEDSRRNTQIKPKSETTNRATGGITGGGGGGGSDRVNKRPASADAKNQSQMELERKKHQDMVKAASASAKNDRSQSAPPLQKSMPKNDLPPKLNLSARQIQASAVQASAKRMSLAERAAQADQDRRNLAKRLKAEARNPQQTNREDPAQQIQDSRSADDGKREEEIKRAEELKRKAEADLAAVAAAKAKLAAQAAKQSEIKPNIIKSSDKGEANKSQQLKSLDSKERIEAALLGAFEPDDPDGGGRDENQAKNQINQQTTDNVDSSKRPDKAKTAQRKPRLPQYDVIFMKDKKNDVDASQILEGSLKDLLKDGSTPTRRSTSGDLNY